jgi:hypothetical protein
MFPLGDVWLPSRAYTARKKPFADPHDPLSASSSPPRFVRPGCSGVMLVRRRRVRRERHAQILLPRVKPLGICALRFGPSGKRWSQCVSVHSRARYFSLFGKPYVSHNISASAKQTTRIWKTSALQEAQAKALRLSGQRKNGIASFFVWPVADDEEIIIVVHELQRSRNAFSHLFSGRANPRRHFRRELRDAACEHSFGRGTLHGNGQSESWLGFVCRATRIETSP